MRELISRIKRPLKNERGDIPVFACFFGSEWIVLAVFAIMTIVGLLISIMEAKD